MMDDAEMEVVNSDSSSIGEAVSGRGANVDDDYNEDEDLYYIPERRPSLDLGTSPMDTTHWRYVGQAVPPVLSYLSMTSGDNSSRTTGEDSISEDEISTRIQLSRSDSFSSCYSFDSDDCEKKTPKDTDKKEAATEISDTPELFTNLNEMGHPSLTVKFTFTAICNTLKRLSEEDMKKFKKMLWKRYPQCFITPIHSMDIVNFVDRLLEYYSLEVSLQITKTLLEEMKFKKLVNYLQTLCIRNEVRYDLSQTLRKKYIETGEGFTTQAAKSSLDDVFTDLFITTACDNGPNIDHEVMTIEKLDSNRDQGTLLSTKDILSAERLEQSNLRFMLITGVAGSGKSTAVGKLILDWIEERSHQHVSFLFPLPFRELKQFESHKASLIEILQTLYPETKKLRDEDYRSEDCKIMFVFDGLDEYNGNLDFQNTEPLRDHTNPTTLNILVVNLLRGWLYRGLFVITSRPPVKRCLSWDAHYDEAELRGFCEPEKDEYFKKRFQEPEQAARIIAYINSLKTLRIMCHLPLFCSLVADECERIFTERGIHAELPRSITYMYTKLLLTLIHQHRSFRAPALNPEKDTDFLMKLGKLAFSMLDKGQFKMTKSDWKETGIDEEEAVTNSGLCTQYVTKPFVLVSEKVLSFIHPTMQEYLAALYAFLSLRNHGKNIFEQQLKQKFKGMWKVNKEMDLYKGAVDRSLQCEDGKLDIFLRFLFGMATKTNQDLLQPFCNSSVKWHPVIEDAAALITKKIRENHHPERTRNLQHCLEELGVSGAASS
ncbi:protein NLRC3 [Cheilinus undulatus]|uniref:protein NLRC3 n=1 Tax=Cheilinus undulatus TaxID=241271 RepID=UPI001BD442A5|nr:protein NLRC3 [Cheilinus undulatus]XP_041657930.1 protein NLRC3 [Cheilinus undulatus]